jgi:hypothetical protein
VIARCQGWQGPPRSVWSCYPARPLTSVWELRRSSRASIQPATFTVHPHEEQNSDSDLHFGWMPIFLQHCRSPAFTPCSSTRRSRALLATRPSLCQDMEAQLTPWLEDTVEGDLLLGNNWLHTKLELTKQRGSLKGIWAGVYEDDGSSLEIFDVDPSRSNTVQIIQVFPRPNFPQTVPSFGCLLT